MKKKISAIVAVAAFVIGINSLPAYAYLGESGTRTCYAPRSILTTVRSTHDHHHRVNTTNYDRPSTSSSVWQSNRLWGARSGSWQTGSYNGSYDYASSGATCST